MNVKERILQLNFEHTGEKVEINDLLLTIITKYQFFEPCKYLSEDEEWLNIRIVSLEDSNVSQALSILKSEITTLGIYNHEEVEVNFTPQMGSEDLYQ